MKRIFAILLFILATITVGNVYGQEDDEEAEREQTRARMEKLLNEVGPAIDVVFTQSQKEPFNFVGTLKTGLVNTESLGIVVSVTANDTIGFRIYPHYKNGYINVDKVMDRAAFMRLLLRLSDRAFLYWGADESGDIFTGYTFTLESGFPTEAITIVLKSIVNSDKFIGEMRPLLDAPIADVTEKKPSPTVKPRLKVPAAKAKPAARRHRRP
jgi:hypothetical protein